MSVSCKKEEPEPTIADFCGFPDKQFIYIKTFENARADIDLGSGTFVIEGLRNQYQDVQEIARFCPELGKPFVDKLIPTHDFSKNTPQPYKCRIWGDIYDCNLFPTIVARNIYFIRLKKIEYIN